MLKKLWLGLMILAQAIFIGGMPLATQAESTPIISAVQITGGVGHTSDDFIELYNPSDQPFNLNGYRLVKRTAAATTDTSIKSWTTDTFIPAHSFYLWANSTYASISTVPDFTSTGTLSDNNGVALRFGPADTGTLIDSFSWGTATNGFNVVSANNPAANESLARVNLFDVNLGYEIHASNPRNSAVQVLPPIVTPPPTPVDNALCNSADQTLSALTNQAVPVSLSFTNNGTTTWDANYDLTDTINHYVLNNSVVPNTTASFNISLNSGSAGQHLYQFQMEKGTTVFGQKCSVILNVSEPTLPPTPTTVRLNELLPNPTGDDAGLEKIELYNYGAENVNLKDWVLDDISPTDPVSSNAYTFAESVLAPQNFLVITLPAGSFALNNTGGDSVTLFDSTGTSVDSVIYESAAPENQSFSYFSDGWLWTNSTLGAENIKPVTEPPTEEPPQDPPPPINVIPKISINEVYSFPKVGQTEFLELFNFGSVAVNTKTITLQIGDKHKLLPDIQIPAGGYFIVQDKNLPASLRNSGQVIKLFDNQNQLVDELNYPKSARGQSYAKFEDGFLWTIAITPAAPNQLVIPEDKKSVPAATVKNDAKPKPPITKSTASKPKTSPTIPAAMAVQDDQENGPASQSTAIGQPQKKKWPVLPLVVAGLGTVSAGMWMSYRYGFKEQPDFV